MGIAKRTFLLLMLLSISGVALVSCKDKGASDSSSDSTPAPTPPPTPPPATTPAPPPAVTPTVPLALKLDTIYETQEYVNHLTFQETGTDLCAASAATPNVTCTVTIPEGRLYYSKLHFAYARLPANCKLMIFQPYMYLASVSPTYYPPSKTDFTDCSGGNAKADCYGGAAPHMLGDFPKHTAFIYTPNETDMNTATTATQDLPSAYNFEYKSNRHSVNDMPLAKRNTNYTKADLSGGAYGTPGDGYVAGSYLDYTFTCRDDWYDPVQYQIHLNIRDEDSATGNPVEDDFWTWAELP